MAQIPLAEVLDKILLAVSAKATPTIDPAAMEELKRELTAIKASGGGGTPITFPGLSDENATEFQLVENGRKWKVSNDGTLS